MISMMPSLFEISVDRGSRREEALTFFRRSRVSLLTSAATSSKRELWRRILSGALAVGLLGTPGLPGAEPAPGNEAKWLSNTRQLTYEGKRSGEGYYSPDGKALIFQSEREADNPF